MNETEIIQRTEVLPDRFAGRLPPDTLESLRLMEAGGEYGELLIELAAALAKYGVPVTARERDELRDLLAASGMPVEAVGRLIVADG